MALIECNECHQQISDTAYFCPKCGSVKKQIWLEDTGKVYKTLSYFVGMLSSLLYFVSYKPLLFSRDFVNFSNVSKVFFLVIAAFLYIIGVLNCKTKIKAD
jgi:hypothetical protein